MDQALGVATGRDEHATLWTNTTVTLDELLGLARNAPESPEKGKHGCLYPGLLVRSPGPRRKSNVDAMTAFVADLDSAEIGEWTPEQFPWGGVAWETYNSGVDGPRYRIWASLSRPVRPAEEQAVKYGLPRALADAGVPPLDESCLRFPQMAYKPERRPGVVELRTWDLRDRPPLDVEAIVAIGETLVPERERLSSDDRKRDPFGLPGLPGVFNQVHDDLDELIGSYDLPYLKHGERWAPTGSRSPAGVVELRPGLWMSFHSARDPIGDGHAYSAYDIVRRHRFPDDDWQTGCAKMDELAAADPLVQEAIAAASAGEFGVVPRAGLPEPSGEPAADALRRCRETFARWLSDGYDLAAVDFSLTVAAVEQLDGDPLWGIIVSGSGNAKTETVVSLKAIGAHVESTIVSEGALLSATPKRERGRTATGGLLRKVGPSGVVVIKDFTSILSMPRETRGGVLGALREVYDGHWTRNVGTDGGQTLIWSGRIAVIAAVTSAWDSHHAVIASMGERFALLRVDSGQNRQQAGRQALANTGDEKRMRADLGDAVKAVIAAMDRTPTTLTPEEAERLLMIADLVTRGRTAVERDFKGTPLYAHAPEAPTRLAKQLGQIVRGGTAIGMTREEAMRLAMRVGRDCLPPIRAEILRVLPTADQFEDLAADFSTHEVCRFLDKPRTTVDRELQALHLLGLVTYRETKDTHHDRPVVRWRYRLAGGVDSSLIGADA